MTLSLDPKAVGAFLTVDLKRIAKNWKAISNRVSPSIAGAVLKTNAYGLGSEQVGKALYEEGCRDFFTAYLHEAVALRKIMPEANIFTLHGALNGTIAGFIDNNITPVLATMSQLKEWNHFGDAENFKVDVALHVDTGMTRLGLTQDYIDYIVNHSDEFQYLNVKLVVSHLACADEPEKSKSDEQLALFKSKTDQLRKVFGDFKTSLSASDGIKLSNKEFYCDLVRPGLSLYDNAISLEARILQIQTAKPGQTIGYGATKTFTKETKVATLGIGYGDGYPRTLGNKGFVSIAGKLCLILGKISMDLTTVDVSEIDDKDLQSSPTAEIFGPNLPIDDVAKWAGTISYELLTNLSNRYYRIYQ
ncbi:MAG: alanine racemase [Alphaproteobacteria bacterium]|nr:alanine racemase [Alphaproteobacteria bacterium]